MHLLGSQPKRRAFLSSFSALFSLWMVGTYVIWWYGTSSFQSLLDLETPLLIVVGGIVSSQLVYTLPDLHSLTPDDDFTLWFNWFPRSIIRCPILCWRLTLFTIWCRYYLHRKQHLDVIYVREIKSFFIPLTWWYYLSHLAHIMCFLILEPNLY